MECKGCGKNINGEEYRDVADWQFCLECFERLMNKPVQGGESAPAGMRTITGNRDGVEDRTGISTPEDETRRCGLCEKELAPGEGGKLGIWTLCPGCRQALVAAPDPRADPAAAGEVPDDVGTEEKAADDEPRSGDDQPIHPQVRATFMQSVNCSGCGRRIPLGGSKLLDGEPYCPDCFYARSRSEAAGTARIPTSHAESAGPPPPAPQPGDAISAADGNRTGEPSVEEATVKVRSCESCGRDAIRGNLTQVEGFFICRACLATDPDLALSIARARHQKRLEQIRSELGGF